MKKAFEILSLRQVLLCPKDWTETKSFWRDTLGLELAADGSQPGHGAVAMKLGGTHLIVSDVETQRDEELGFEARPGQPYLYVSVRGLEALVEHLRLRGTTILAEPRDLHWGPRMAVAGDPDGVPVIFVEGDPDPALVAKYGINEK